MMKPYRPIPAMKHHSEDRFRVTHAVAYGLLTTDCPIKSGRCERQARPVPSIGADVEAASVCGLPELNIRYFIRLGARSANH